MADWNKLKTGKFYNPVTQLDKIDASKLLIIHARDDRSVGYRAVARFAKKVGAALITKAHGGHGGVFDVTKPPLFKKISRFLRA